MVFFEKKVPYIYEGDLLKEEELLGWLVHQKRHSEIPEITDEMLDSLIQGRKYVAALFCKSIHFLKVTFKKLQVLKVVKI